MRYSEKEKFNNCPYAYQLAIVEGLTKIEDGSSANDKNWGAGIHAGLEAYYQKKGWDEVKKAFLAVYPTSLSPDDQAKSVENGIKCLEMYINYYMNQDKMWEVLATEEKGVIGFGGEDHELHIDLIARNRQSSEIYFWDHKTANKTPSPTYWKGYELSGQLTRYTVYVQEKYGECAGAYINNIAVGHRLRMYKGEPAGFWAKFERQLFNRTKAQIEDWKRSDENWMKLIEFCKKENVWPKSLGKLCGWCDFYELCLASGDPQIKELMYETKITA